MFLDLAFGYTANSFNRNWVTNMTYKKTLAVLVAVTLTIFGVGAYAQKSVAPESPHQAEALEHAKQAVAAGKQGDAAGLVEHAEEAKKHAIMAQKDFTSFKLQEAGGHLAEAITAGKAGQGRCRHDPCGRSREGARVRHYPDDPGQP